MRSIRRQLLVFVLTGLAVVLLAAGGVLYGTVRSSLSDQFDDGLRTRAEGLSRLLEYVPDVGGLEYDSDELPAAYEREGPDAEYFALWLADGRRFALSETLAETALDFEVHGLDKPVTWDMELPDGRTGRAMGLALRIQPDPEADWTGDVEELPSVTVFVARGRGPLDDTLASLGLALALAGGTAVLLAWVLVRFAVGQGLLPVARLGDQVAAIDATTLATRVDAFTPAELQPFARKLNELLERLQHSFDKERRMTAAIAHELRNPIAELRTAAELAQRWPDDDAMIDQVVTAADDVSGRMSQLVDDIMHYCRVETGADALQVEELPLADLVDVVWRAFETAAEQRGVTLANSIPRNLALGTDRALLSIALGNLLANASRFAPDDSAVEATLSEGRDGEMQAVFENLAPDLVYTDLQHLTEPFWQKETSRRGDHSGLGLTLVASILQRLGYELDFELRSGRLTVSITIPAGEAAERPLAPDHLPVTSGAGDEG